MTQQTYNLQWNVMSRNANPYRLLVNIQNFGNPVAGLENEGEGTRQQPFQDLEFRRIQSPDKPGDMTQVETNEGEVQLVRPDVLDPAEAFDGLAAEQIAADTVYRVGGKYNDAVFLQDLHHVFDLPWFGILWMDFDKLSWHPGMRRTYPDTLPAGDPQN